MSSYLLSSGTVTDNINSYIKDIVSLELTVPKDSIPYYTYGSEFNILDIKKDDIETRVTAILQDVITDIKKHNDVDISLVSVSINNGRVAVEMKFQNKINTLTITV